MHNNRALNLPLGHTKSTPGYTSGASGRSNASGLSRAVSRTGAGDRRTKRFNAALFER